MAAANAARRRKRFMIAVFSQPFGQADPALTIVTFQAISRRPHRLPSPGAGR
jgi:hypothetical protein